MKLRRVNESIDDLLESIEYTLVGLRDEGFLVSVLLINGESIDVAIRLKNNKATQIEPIYSYLEEVFDYIKHYDKSINSLNIDYLSVHYLDKSIGKTLNDESLANASDFNELKDSINFCLFINDRDTEEFSSIKFFIE